MKKTSKKNKVLGPILVIGVITITIMIISSIMSLIGIEGQVVDTTNGSIEMTMVMINNIFSIDGIKFLISNTITNFRLIEPLALLIISLIAVSIVDSSGLLKHIISPLKKINTKVLIFLTILLSVVLTFLGDYSFIILLPFIGIVYKYLGKNPMLGILTVFIGITCGYGTGIIYNYNTFALGEITQLSATMEVDPNFTYDVLSCCYIMVVSTFIITFIGTAIINKYLVPKFKKVQLEEDETKYSNKALWYTNIATLIILIITGIMILPGGILLDNSQTTYIAKLMSNTSPFRDGFMFILLFTLMITSWIYGKVSGNFKNKMDYNLGLYKNFENIGYVFVLMFFASIMISVLNWTNLGVVLSGVLINLVSSFEFSGSILIIVFFFFAIIISVMIPDTFTKWNMIAPLIVPLFMRANITPEFTQFIFMIADGVGKSISPFFIYFVIMLGFLQKYNDNNNKEITIMGVLKDIIPIVSILALVWLLLIVCWNIIGLPLGIETFTTI